MKRLTPILISILVFATFLLSNVTTVFALNNFLILKEDITISIPCSTDYYHLQFEGGEYLTPNGLLTDYSDKVITIVNSSNQTFELLGKVSDSGNTQRIIKFESGQEYILDFAFWEEFSQTNSYFESMKDRNMYITCWSNVSGGSLQITLSSNGSGDSTGDGTGTGSGDSTEDDDSGLFESIKEFFSGLFEDIPTWIDNAVASIGEFFSQIPTWISNAVDSIGEFFANLITKIGEFVDSAVENIGEFFSTVGQWISDAVASVGEFFSNMFNSIAEFFSDLVESVVEWFKNKKEEEETKKGFWESLGEKLKELIDKLAGFTLQPVKEFFSGLVNSDVVSVLSTIYEFPIIKEMIILVVAVLVVTGLLGLLLTF